MPDTFFVTGASRSSPASSNAFVSIWTGMPWASWICAITSRSGVSVNSKFCTGLLSAS